MNSDFSVANQKANFLYQGYLNQMVDINKPYVNVLKMSPDGTYQYLEEFNRVQNAIDYVNNLVTIK